ncbi:putative peptidase M16 inactive domain-containing protein [Colletotrichum sublineola]|uniref:Putative peptidase M16 inactive domain-containing protein n=1 Tax=Colletotrichum sublineola TaxID=1173701 RepID=A0A066XF98_COLSU|nr:putative peptidase M16 inactive domain-containing protein [Colletotrichum sublineola]
MNSNTFPVELITDKVEAPDDGRISRVVKLKNDVEVLLIHDGEARRASASLDVNVGYFNDGEVPGTAHALEHAILQLIQMGGSKQYGPNEYAEYLQIHSGFRNAETTTTSTTYYFDVSAGSSDEHGPPPLKEALARFADLFTAPSFSELALDSEIKAIQSEYESNWRDDNVRLVHLERSLSNPNHPYQKFSTGNIESLKNWPKANGIDVRASIMEFYSKHYSANRMKLVVIGREELNVLQEWVATFFSGIPDKNLAPQRWEDEAPLQKGELGTRILVNPIMDVRILKLVFPFLDQEMLFDAQPGKYVSHLIGHKSPGSIMAFTKNNNWVDQVKTSFTHMGPGVGDLFECQIQVTEEVRCTRRFCTFFRQHSCKPQGLKNYEEVLKVFFQYVSLLKEKPPQLWIFEELQTMADLNFKHQERVSEVHFTREISMRMQKPLPRDRLLSGDTQLRCFEPDLIKKALACLRPDNFRLTIVSQTFRGVCDQKEKWYGIEYRVEKLPDDLMDELKTAASCTAFERPRSLHLPDRNIYIPSSLVVKERKATELTKRPRKIIDEDSARIWFHQDNTPPSPRAMVHTSFHNPNIRPSLKDILRTTLLGFLLQDTFETEYYQAGLASLQYQISSNSRVIYLRISGYSEKLPDLMMELLTRIKSFKIPETRYANIFGRTKRFYSNCQLREPYKQIIRYMSCLHSAHAFTVDDFSAELLTVTLESVKEFKEAILSPFYIESYYSGNLSESDVQTMVNMKTAILGSGPSRDTRHVFRSLPIPHGANYIYRKLLKDPRTVNNCIEYCLYTGKSDDALVCTKTRLLKQLSYESAFHQLRTVENLGYILESKVRDFVTTFGFSLTIQSQRSPEYPESRIEAFLHLFSVKLSSMSDDAHKRSVTDKLSEKPENLAEESKKHWDQIKLGTYDFDQEDMEDAEKVKTLTKSDMVGFFKTCILPGSNKRAKVSVHLVPPSSPLISETSAKGGSHKPIYVRTIDDFKAAIKRSADFKG